MLVNKERDLTFKSFDGVQLEGTYSEPAKGSDDTDLVALLVHGAHADRNETGFYERMATALANTGISSFRFDFRCHGVDSSRPIDEITLTAVNNDITAAALAVQKQRISKCRWIVISASFSGGITINWAARNKENVSTVFLLNPVVDYMDEYISGQQKGDDTLLNASSISELEKTGVIVSQRKPFNRAIINEFRDYNTEPCVDIPHWIFHGDIDTGVSIKTSRQFAERYANVTLFEIPGAEHGFVEPGDWKMETEATLKRHEQLYSSILNVIKRMNS